MRDQKLFGRLRRIQILMEDARRYQEAAAKLSAKGPLDYFWQTNPTVLVLGRRGAAAHFRALAAGYLDDIRDVCAPDVRPR